MHNRIYVLDWLRGVLALVVVVHHIPVQAGDFAWHFYNIPRIVDMFFFMSGIVITKYKFFSKAHFSLRSFISDRVAYLYPLHLVALLLMVMISVIKRILIPEVTTEVDAFGISLVLSLLMLNSTYYPGDNPGFNYPSWSISAEFICYLVIGWLFLKLDRSRLFYLIITVLFLVAGWALLEYQFLFDATHSGGVILGLVNFCAGALVYSVFSRYGWELGQFKLGVPMSFGVIAVLGGYVAVLVFALPSFSPAVLMVTGWAVVSFLALLSVESSFNKISRWLGELSYPVYITHAVSISVVSGFFKFVLVPRMPNLSIGAGDILTFSETTYLFGYCALVVGVSVLMAVVLNRLVVLITANFRSQW